MGKIVFWLVVFFAVLFVLRMINVAKTRARRQRDAAEAGKREATPPSAMVRCVECGVFVSLPAKGRCAARSAGLPLRPSQLRATAQALEPTVRRPGTPSPGAMLHN
jgi:hypothetical protein